MEDEAEMLREVMQIILNGADDKMYIWEIKELYTGVIPLKLSKIKSYPLLFEINKDKDGHYVTIVAHTKICPNYATPSGCQYSNCWMFHVCKFYILSKSCFQKPCRFRHTLKSEHNLRLLRLLSLDHPAINIDQHRMLFRRLSCRTRASVPIPCNFYNWNKSCKKGDKCNDLHICKHILFGEWKFGNECKRNHSVYLENVQLVLNRFGINIHGEYYYTEEDADYDYDKEYGEFNYTKATDKFIDTTADEDEDKKEEVEEEVKEELEEEVKEELEGKVDEVGEEEEEDYDYEEERVIQALIKIYNDNNITLESLRAKSYNGPKLITDITSSDPSYAEDGSDVDKHNSTSSQLVDIDPLNNICIYYLRGSCRFEDRCRNIHVNSTYQWQWIPDTSSTENQWENLETNLEIERCYCNLQEMIRFISGTETTHLINLDYFEENDVQIRRLSTVDLMPQTSLFCKPWTTKWLWYWLDNDGKWIEYGIKGSVGNFASVISQDIETAYKESGNGELSFTTQDTERREQDKQSYILDFKKMKQINVKYGTQRKIKRRPEFVDDSVLQERKVECERRKKSEKLSIPSHWSQSPNEDIYSHRKMVELYPCSTEYLTLKESIVSGSSVVKSVISIKRIENVELWTAFCVEKAMMDKKLHKDVPIQRLYHSTETSIIEAICLQGFDSRLSGSRVGHLYGKGGYFGINSDVSCNYCDGNNLMFIVKALVGDYTLGQENYLRPPLKNPNDPSSDLYDSCVDNMDSPTMFVLFNNRQVYPEYLVKFIKNDS